jgi:hypothetical protein
MGYRLEGDLLEVCDCKVLCPCWIGEDPDNGGCRTALAYVMRAGEIDGVDVSGLVVAVTAWIPGNVLDGGYVQKIYVDARADEAQGAALAELMLGRRGGPFEALAALVAETVGIERAAIEYTVAEGSGRFRIAGVVEAEMTAYRGPGGRVTTLHESIFSTIPGSPAYVGKAERFVMREPALGIDLDLRGHNAIQGVCRFEHPG